MIPTFVFGWPTGEEKGDFLALDLGMPFYTLYMLSPVAARIFRLFFLRSGVKSLFFHPNLH
jgi:hypothetical protein